MSITSISATREIILIKLSINSNVLATREPGDLMVTMSVNASVTVSNKEKYGLVTMSSNFVILLWNELDLNRCKQNPFLHDNVQKNI